MISEVKYGNHLLPRNPRIQRQKLINRLPALQKINQTLHRHPRPAKARSPAHPLRTHPHRLIQPCLLLRRHHSSLSASALIPPLPPKTLRRTSGVDAACKVRIEPMTHPSIFRSWIIGSFALAIAALGVVRNQMPLDYHGMIWRSTPLACLWLVVCICCLARYRRRGLWVLLGAPLALLWPLILVWYGLPKCYWIGNCL